MRRSGPLRRRTPMPRPSAPVKRTAPVPGSAVTVPAQRRQAPRRETGFPAEVRRAVRRRAGNGEIEDAACECCGRWLGRYGGQVHHRMNRGMGGSRLRNGIQNAALLCGTPDDFSTCHGRATREDEHMKAMGFVLVSGQDPAAEPIMLHGQDGGVTVWLTESGYSTEAPGRAA